MEGKCKFYELDLEAQKEAEEMVLPFPELSADEGPEEERETDDPFSSCGAFCKYLKSGKGYPGEYVYYCCAKGNEHVIDVDFNESEII